MDYYEHVASLPEKLRDIHEFCWDFTGRPTLMNSYPVAIGRLCEISNDWKEFSDHCDRFFFEPEHKKEHTLQLAWHCYIKGMHVLGDRLSKKD